VALPDLVLEEGTQVFTDGSCTAVPWCRELNRASWAVTWIDKQGQLKGKLYGAVDAQRGPQTAGAAEWYALIELIRMRMGKVIVNTDYASMVDWFHNRGQQFSMTSLYAGALRTTWLTCGADVVDIAKVRAHQDLDLLRHLSPEWLSAKGNAEADTAAKEAVICHPGAEGQAPTSKLRPSWPEKF